MANLIKSIVFDRDATNDALTVLNGNRLADEGPVNPLLLIFKIVLKDGQVFEVHTNRWAAGHTEAFHARLVLVSGERLGLPVAEVGEDKPLKADYHRAWFAQYPPVLSTALGLSREAGQDLYDNVTRYIQTYEPVVTRYGAFEGTI